MERQRRAQRARFRKAAAALTAALLAVTLTQGPAQAQDPGPAIAGDDAGFDTGPAARVLERVIGVPRARQVSLRPIDKGAGPDRFQVSAEHGRLVVAGTTPAVQLTGFGYYLRRVVHADLSIGSYRLELPARLPLPAAPLTEDASVAHRFALNDTNEGYAGPYLSWEEWQRRIDVLALRGINEMLVYEGQDAVYQRTFTKFGYTAEDMRRWIPQPGHQAWWLLQNMCCQDSPISQQLIDRRAKLGRRITDRLRELGMTPVLPGYYGTVPTDFETRNPGANTVAQGTWNGLERPDWLDPTGPQFGRIAGTFYREQQALFGPSTMFKMDLLHEGGRPGTVPVPAASQAVQRALEAAHPGATWVILGWQNNPRKDLLQAVDRSKMFIVDGITEQPNITDREADFLGAPYAFGTIWNFGGHQSFGAAVTEWNRKFHAWRARPGTKMDGIALMPEAIDNNPAAVAFFADLPWRDGPQDINAWFEEYADARYGGADPHARAAWRTIGATAYDWPAGADTRHVTGLFDDQPGLSNTGHPLQYDPAEFEKALAELLKVDPRLRRAGAYRYDLVDVARQVLANRSRALLPRIRAAYTARDRAALRRLTGRWMDQIRLMDRVLGADAAFLLGAWEKEAARQAASPQEAATLDYNVKSLVTLWASGSPGLQDYARREFNGLVGGYYAERWQMFFAELDRSLATGRDPRPIDWREVAEDWARDGTRHQDRPRGDAHALAGQVAAEPAGDLAVRTDHAGIRPGGTVRATATFTNASATRTARGVRLRLDAPRGYRIRPEAAAPATVPPGETVTATWTVTAPRDARPGSLPDLDAAVRWRTSTGDGGGDGDGDGDGGGRDGDETARTSLLVGGPVTAPYETAGNTDHQAAQSGQAGDTVGIAAGGRDLWGGTAELATVHRTGGLPGGQAVATRVTRLDGASDWSRAGLVAARDLSTPGAGTANIAVTPGHGCVFSWDSDGDGRYDKYTETGGFAEGTYVRLRRDGDRVTGSCSTDAANWAVVGTGTAPAAKDSADVGMFVSAVNAHTGREAIGVFGGGIAGSPDTSRDPSGDALVSLRRPVTALSSEAGRPPENANDGNHANSPYWGGQMPYGHTWWRVDLGGAHQVSRIVVRNYVDGTRYYTHRVEGSLDGRRWYTLGGRNGPRPAANAGDVMTVEGRARYVRVVGLGNTANLTFHLSEVDVYGAPAGPAG